MLKHMMAVYREVDEDEYMSQKSPKVDKEDLVALTVMMK